MVPFSAPNQAEVPGKEDDAAENDRRRFDGNPEE
jgi:hypothetical protein